MNAIVHHALEAWARETLGDAVWERSLGAPCGADGEVSARHTGRALGALCGHTHREPAEVLGASGRFLIVHAARCDLDLPRLLGEHTLEALARLDALLLRLSRALGDAPPPALWAVVADDHSADLHWETTRHELGPWLEGLVRGLADAYGQRVDVARAPGADAVALRVRVTP